MTATLQGVKSHGGSTDGSKAQIVLRYHVDSLPPGALSDITLPPIGTPYPLLPPDPFFPMLADRYDWEPVGDNKSTWVDVVYSNDRSGRLAPHPDKTRPGFQSASVDFQDTLGEFPAVLTYPAKVPGTNGTTARFGDTTIYKPEETRVVYEINVVLQGFQNANQFAVIGQQNGRLHKIQGRYYRFKAGRITQTEKTAWETTYTWTEDTGTPPPLGFTPGGAYVATIPIGPSADERTLFLPPAGQNKLKEYDATLNDNAIYVRSPYHFVSFYMTNAMQPVWYQILQHRLDANGWQALPGNLQL